MWSSGKVDTANDPGTRRQWTFCSSAQPAIQSSEFISPLVPHRTLQGQKLSFPKWPGELMDSHTHLKTDTGYFSLLAFRLFPNLPLFKFLYQQSFLKFKELTNSSVCDLPVNSNMEQPFCSNKTGVYSNQFLFPDLNREWKPCQHIVFTKLWRWVCQSRKYFSNFFSSSSCEWNGHPQFL